MTGVEVTVFTWEAAVGEIWTGVVGHSNCVCFERTCLAFLLKSFKISVLDANFSCGAGAGGLLVRCDTGDLGDEGEMDEPVVGCADDDAVQDEDEDEDEEELVELNGTLLTTLGFKKNDKVGIYWVWLSGR